MAIMFILYGVSILIAYITINVALIVMRNFKAHQFYKTHSPKLPVLSDPNIFHGHMWNVTFQNKNWKIIDALHKKMGPTFGYYMCDQPWVSTKDLDLLKLIEMDKPHKHINRCKLGLPFKEFQDSIFQLEDDHWRRVRRAVAPALTNQKVKSQEVSSDIEQVIEQLAEGIEHRMQQAQRLTGERSVILDMGDMCHRYALAVIFLITYKRDRQIDFKAEHDKWSQDIERSARGIRHPAIGLSVIFPFIRSTLGALLEFHEMGRLRVQITDYIVEATDINRLAREQHKKIQRRLSMQTGNPERPFSALIKTSSFKRRLVDTIIDALIDRRIGYDEFMGTTVFLLLAGFETTAGTLTCLVWQLAREPAIQEKLREAIKRDGVEAEYLIWCIQEAVRWHPAVPLGVGRVLGEDVDVNGLHLAKGTFVMPSTHSIHHDPQIWPEPERFKPERWQNASDYHPAAFMGFGLGPRNCVGGKLAVHEIKLAMRYLLSNFKIIACSETPESYEFSAPGLVYTIIDSPVKVRLVDLEDPLKTSTTTTNATIKEK